MQTNNLVIGAGKLFIDLFVPGTETTTGELYLGNTPSLTLTRSYQDLPHYTSDFKDRVMDDNFTLQTDIAIAFSCDNISSELVAMMHGTTPAPETTTAVTSVDETFTDVKLGRYYQLGKSITPAGVGTVANVTATIGVTPVTATGNFTVDLALGRVFILPNAADIDLNDDVIFSFDTVLQTRTAIIADNAPLEGAVRFIADNRKGTNKDHYWPRVRLQPTGDFALKGETWQIANMNGAVLEPSDGRKRSYVYDRTGA